MLSKLFSNQSRAIVQHSIRSFGPKAQGGAPAETYRPPTEIKSPLKVLLEERGVDAFMFGPPPGVNKLQNAHRDLIAP